MLTQIGYKITESFRLEKILKNIESNCKPSTSKFTDAPSKSIPYIFPPTWRRERKKSQGCLSMMGEGGEGEEIEAGKDSSTVVVRWKGMGTLLKASRRRLRAMSFD